MPRLIPEIAFPPYSYVTGRWPHPTRDAAGHSFGHVEAAPPTFDPVHWQDSPQFLYAIDLFNHGYHWESHEAWESLWHAVGRRGATADFLKGLIKLAAAGVKVREGRPEGVRRHALRAIELFESVRGSLSVDSFCGLELPELIVSAKQIANEPPVSADPSAPVEVVFSFQLAPVITGPQSAAPDPR